jgi:superfamily II RNA helicase
MMQEEKERQHIARTTEHARQALVKRHLLRFMPELGELEAYHDIMNLLKRGIAYHHAGMLPILREFVELSFQARLVKVSLVRILSWHHRR